jgi:hypothetical protein
MSSEQLKQLEDTNQQMSDDRVGWVASALQHYNNLVRGDEKHALIDLLADLMHWCDRDGRDFAFELSTARMHYEAELDLHRADA